MINQYKFLKGWTAIAVHFFKLQKILERKKKTKKRLPHSHLLYDYETTLLCHSFSCISVKDSFATDAIEEIPARLLGINIFVALPFATVAKAS